MWSYLDLISVFRALLAAKRASYLALELAMIRRRLVQSGLVAAVVLSVLPSVAHADNFIIANGYHAQQTTFYCGPAAEQMMLDTPAVLNNYVNPVLPTQNALYAIAQANNLEPWFTSPAGMVAGLNASDGGFHNYAWYATATINQNSREIANALNDYSVPASVLIRGGQHWVDINGVKTTGAIARNQPYTINGFYGRDPWPAAGTLGQNFFLAFNSNPRSPWARLFTPVSSGNIWRGSYVSVLEPQGPELPDDGSNNSIALPPPQLGSELNATGADTDAISDVAADSVLSTVPGFENGSFDTADETLDHYSSDPSTEGDWIVPYDGSGGVNDITGAVAIDADTGAIDYATWEDPGQQLALTDLDTLYADVFSDQLVDDSGEQAPEPTSLAILGASSLLMLRRRR